MGAVNALDDMDENYTWCLNKLIMQYLDIFPFIGSGLEGLQKLNHKVRWIVLVIG